KKLLEPVAESADTGNLDRNGASWLHGSHPDRGAAQDDIAGVQRHVLRDQAHQLLHRKAHVADRVVMTDVSVEDSFHHELCRVKTGGHYRPERAKRIETLGTHPL